MVTPALRQLIREAPRAGTLEAGDGPFGTGRAEHAVCGDVVEFDVRVADGRLVDLAWRADGCPATLAVAAAAGAALVGVPPGGVPSALGDALIGRGGLAAHERHAERIVVEALTAALEDAT